MPEFAWRALDAQGQTSTGVANANTQKELIAQLRARGLIPLEVDSPGRITLGPTSAGEFAGATQKPPLRSGRLVSADIFHFTSELAIMLRSGLALDNALRLLEEMSVKRTMAELVSSTLDAVKNGATLSKALSAHPKLFDDFYINMLRSGEASGQLASVLERVFEHMQRQKNLRDSVISASIYPAILLAVAILSLVAMLGFVVPQFETLFKDLGDALPMPTQMVVALGKLFTDHWITLLIAALCGYLLVSRWSQSPAGQRMRHRLLLRLPVLGPIAAKYQLSLFARTLGTLSNNGVPLLRAVEIATETVSNTHIRSAILPLPQKLKSGARISHAVQGLQVFDPLAINLIKVGEETGRLGPMLLELANLFNRDVETGIKRALTMLEPLLILVLGGLIAAIIVAILLGILSVNDLAL